MQVVLDANVWFADVHLRGIQANRLRQHVRFGHVTVLVPYLVTKEVAGQIRRETEDALKKLQSLTASLQRFILEPAVEELREQLRVAPHPSGELAAAVAQEFPVAIVSLPSYVTHQMVVERAVSRRRPFDDKGSGYRDTLIWLTAVDLARKGSETISMITDDGAFYSSGSLHPHLAAELEKEGLSGRLSLFRGLKEFVDSLPALPPEKEWVPNQFPLVPRVSEWISERLQQELPQWRMHPRHAGLPKSTTDLVITAVEDVSVEDLGAAEVDIFTGEVYAEFVATALFDLEMLVSSEDAEDMRLHVSQPGDPERVRTRVSKKLEVTGSAQVRFEVEEEEGQPVGWSPEPSDLAVEVETVRPLKGDVGSWFWT